MFKDELKSNLKELFNESTIEGNKIIIKGNLVKTLNFIKQNYGYDFLEEINVVEKK